MLVTQSSPTLCNSLDYIPPGSFVCGILQARILEWIPIPFSRGSFPSRDQTWVSCIVGGLFTIRATREGPTLFINPLNPLNNSIRGRSVNHNRILF